MYVVHECTTHDRRLHSLRLESQVLEVPSGGSPEQGQEGLVALRHHSCGGGRCQEEAADVVVEVHRQSSVSL